MLSALMLVRTGVVYYVPVVFAMVSAVMAVQSKV